MKQKDKILEEYDFNNGARGKYTKAYKEGINIVKLDSDVMKFFPNTKKFGNSEFSTNPIIFYHITKDFIEHFSNITKNLKDNL